MMKQQEGWEESSQILRHVLSTLSKKYNDVVKRVLKKVVYVEEGYYLMMNTQYRYIVKGVNI